MTPFETAYSFMLQLLKLPEKDLLKKHFLEDVSYRSDQRNKNNPLIGLSEYRIISRRHGGRDNLLPETKGLVLTSSKQSIPATKSYIERNLNTRNLSVIYRDDLVYTFKSRKERMLFFGFVLRIIVLSCLNKKNRLNIGLCIREIIEWSRIIELLKEAELSEFIDFSGYEKDSNALAACLKRDGIRVIKIPSPGPLYAHYKFVVADTLVLSSAYQQEELVSISTEWQVSNYLYWPPEHSYQYESIYEKREEPPTKTIGFYSHGEWLRRLEGHADPGLAILLNEETLLNELNLFLQKNTDYTLTIFPHPKERKSEHTENYYREKLNGIPYTFSPAEIPSAQLFHTVEIGLMAYSTLIFERLGMGFKTYIAKYSPSHFPVSTSSLNSILISNVIKLENQILKTESETASKYFERNNLTNHLISNFTKQL